MKSAHALCGQRGFTIIELIIVMGVFSLLSGIVVSNVVRSQHNVSIDSAINTLLVDIRSQQIKTMVGDTSGTGTISNYGIYFSQNSYTLFQGSSYSPSDPKNFTITLDTNLQFSTDTLPSQTLIFSKLSGEFSNYQAGANTIAIQDTQTSQKQTITINKYGVVSQVN